jgi:hypothetical protein
VIALFATLRLLSVDTSHLPALEAHYLANDEAAPILLIDSADAGPSVQIRSDGAQRVARFDVEPRFLVRSEISVQLVAGRQYSNGLNVRTTYGCCPGCQRSTWERIVSWWHELVR